MLFNCKSLGKAIIFLAILAVIPKVSFAQYSTGFVVGTSLPYLYVGSLSPSNASNYEKLQVDIFGGGWDYTTLGRTTYTIANRGNLAINQTTVGGSSGNFFTIKAYANSNGNTDIYIVITNVYPAFTINSVLLNNSAAQVQTIAQYSSAPSETDITPTVLPIMITDQNGNIALNTTNTQGYKFAVNGSAIATSFTVQAYANWSDYVFKSAYKLRSLHDVNAYIDQNHHLPDVPSAEQVAKDGLNLGDMSKITMQKVEELTLYLIEKDKQLNDEKEIVSKQLARIDSQENQLKSQQAQIDLLIKQVAHITNEKSK